MKPQRTWKMTALSNAAEIEATFEKMRTQMTAGLSYVRRKFGSTGWTTEKEQPVYWRAQDKVWCWIGEINDEKWGSSYGLENPHSTSVLTALMEANFNKRPPFRCASCFARDGGSVYLVRQPRVSRKVAVPIAKFRKAFRKWKWAEVKLPNGREVSHVVIGRVGSADFPARVGQFVHALAKFKGVVPVETRKERELRERMSYTPESEGRIVVPPKGRKVHERRHGAVVNALHDVLSRRRAVWVNDKLRDLYELDESGRVRTIFEVKTGTDTSSIYAGIGQLLFHSICAETHPRMVLVLPGRVSRRTADVLTELKIRLLVYHMRQGKPEFPGLDELLK